MGWSQWLSYEPEPTNGLNREEEEEEEEEEEDCFTKLSVIFYMNLVRYSEMIRYTNTRRKFLSSKHVRML
jgi:hypothetical protein